MKEIKSIQEIKNSPFFKVPDKVFGIEKKLLKLFLLPVSIIVLFLVSVGLVIIPKVDEIKNNLSQVEKLKSQIRLNDQKKNYLASIDQEQLNKDASFLNSAVLKEKKSYLLVGVVEKIATDYGFRIRSFSVNPGTLKEEVIKVNTKIKVSESEAATRMPMNITLFGPSINNLDLIKALENSLPIMFIDKFETKSNGGISELELIISCYYIADKSDYTSGNLMLNDLILTEKEAELLAKISDFEDNGQTTEDGLEKDFTKYERNNPFSL